MEIISTKLTPSAARILLERLLMFILLSSQVQIIQNATIDEPAPTTDDFAVAGSPNMTSPHRIEKFPSSEILSTFIPKSRRDTSWRDFGSSAELVSEAKASVENKSLRKNSNGNMSPSHEEVASKNILSDDEFRQVTVSPTPSQEGKLSLTLSFTETFSVEENYDEVGSTVSSPKHGVTPSPSDLEVIDYGALESNFGHMILCQHPPNEFSPDFLGFSGKLCRSGDGVKWFPYTDAMDICYTMYSLIYPEAERLIAGDYLLPDGSNLYIFHKPEFVQICLPIFERFDGCEKRGPLTVCWDLGLAFLDSHDCSPLSDDDIYFEMFLSVFLLRNDSNCFDKICDGSIRVIDSDIQGVHFRLLNTIVSKDNITCGHVYYALRIPGNIDNEVLFVTKNDQWPCCYPLYLVVWVGNPEEKGINGSWDYLPYHCRIAEIAVTVVIALLALSCITGNTLVIIVMLFSKKIHDSYVIRTSIAIADLLKGLFIVLPAFWGRVTPFMMATVFTNMTDELQLTLIAEETSPTVDLLSSTVVSSGFTLFRGLLFSTCSVATVLSLFVLSVERYLITHQALKVHFYFTHCRTKMLIIFCWVVGFIDAVLIACDVDGTLQATVLTFENIPVAYAEESPHGVPFNIVINVQIILFYVVGSATLVFSVMAVLSFHKWKKQVADEWAKYNMRVIGHYSEEDRYIVNTLLLMVILYLVSMMPLSISIFVQESDLQFPHLQNFFSWWCFLAGSAWNPWIYNMRSHRFRADVNVLLSKVIAKNLKGKFSCLKRHPNSD